MERGCPRPTQAETGGEAVPEVAKTLRAWRPPPLWTGKMVSGGDFASMGTHLLLASGRHPDMARFVVDRWHRSALVVRSARCTTLRRCISRSPWPRPLLYESGLRRPALLHPARTRASDKR